MFSASRRRSRGPAARRPFPSLNRRPHASLRSLAGGGRAGHAGVGGGARRCDARRADRCGCRRRRPHVRQHVLARGQPRPVPRPGRARRQGRRRHDGAAGPVGAAQQPVPGRPRGVRQAGRAVRSRPTFVDAGNVRVHYNPGRAHGRLRPERRGQQRRARSPTPTRAPATGCPSPTSARAGATRPTSTSTTSSGSLRLLHDRQRRAAARPGPVRRLGVLRGRQRLRRLPDQHAAGEPPGDPGARVLPRDPVRLRRVRRRLGHGGHRRVGRGRGLRRRRRQRAVPQRQPDHRPQALDRQVRRALPLRRVDLLPLPHREVPGRDRWAADDRPQVLGGRRQLQGRQEGPVLHPGDGRRPEEEALQAAHRQGVRAVLRRQPPRADSSTRRARPTRPTPTRTPRSTARRASNKGQAKTFKADARPPHGRDLPVHAEGQRQEAPAGDLAGRRRRRAPGRS